jgi:hypothetical protein
VVEVDDAVGMGFGGEEFEADGESRGGSGDVGRVKERASYGWQQNRASKF